MNEKVVTSTRFYQYGDQKIEYTLVKSKRRKTSEIIVDEDEIILRTPFEKSVSETEKLMGSKIKWIIDKQNNYREKRSHIAKLDFSDDSRIPYLGHNYEVKIIKKSDGHDKLEFDDKFVFTLKCSELGNSNDRERVRSLYENWLYDRARSIFDEKVTYFSKVIGIHPKKIIIKKLKNRWGSVTNKEINLNFNLIKAPEDIIDYIIIHELCHFNIKGHSHKFWRYVHSFVPNYEDKVNWLAINAKYILS